MKNDTAAIVVELDSITDDFRNSFAGLSHAQLNWRPSPDSWSVAQCIDHLIKSNDEVRPVIDAKIAGAKNSTWESISPFSGFFGRLLKKSLSSDKRKFKAPVTAIVPPSEIDEGILERFVETQEVDQEKY